MTTRRFALTSNPRLAIIGVFLLLIGVAPRTSFAQESKDHRGDSLAQMDDESAVRSAVESLLEALGNDDLEKFRAMVLPNANVAVVSVSKSKIFPSTVEEYISQREGKENRKFQEPVSQFTVEISQGMLAFVRAHATVHYDGKPSHHTDDFFIFMKDNGMWKLFSASYTTRPLEENE